MRIYLSPTKLSLYDDCKRCFFDDVVLKLRRPRGAYPSLPGAIDERLKNYTDSFRPAAPPELAPLGIRLFEDQVAINTYRHWKEGLSCTLNIPTPMPTTEMPGRKIVHTLILSGAIDDLFLNECDAVGSFDFKTKRAEPQDGEGEKWYQVNMDTYAYLIKAMGMDPADEGYLWYFWPGDIIKVAGSGDGMAMNWNQKLVKLNVDPARIATRLEAIAKMLPDATINAGKFQPERGAHCEYCTYLEG